jgi:deoxyribodipyrimidine photo-lyase
MLECLKRCGGGATEAWDQVRRSRGFAPDEVALEAGEKASLIVTDRDYMRPQVRWRASVAEAAGCLVTQVESVVVVPVEPISVKRETAARTLRPRVREHLDEFLVELKPTKPKKWPLNMYTEGLDLSDIESILDGMDLDRSVEP